MNKVKKIESLEGTKKLNGDYVPDSELTVVVDGKGVKLNRSLLDVQDCWSNVSLILDCHRERMLTYAKMEDTDDEEILGFCGELLTNIEYEMQALWGFEQSSAFHRFWRAPKCQCPKMDNEDMYGTGLSYYAADCPVHSKAVKSAKDNNKVIKAEVVKTLKHVKD